MYPFPFIAVGTDINRVQYIAIVGSLAMLAFIFELTRKKKIRVQYAILWFFIGLVFLIFSLWRQGLDVAAKAVGVVYPPAALFLLLILGVFAILVQFSVVISKISDQNTKIIQELGAAQSEIERLKIEQSNSDSRKKP
jgi:hypothetical protein